LSSNSCSMFIRTCCLWIWCNMHWSKSMFMRIQL